MRLNRPSYIKESKNRGRPKISIPIDDRDLLYAYSMIGLKTLSKFTNVNHETIRKYILEFHKNYYFTVNRRFAESRKRLIQSSINEELYMNADYHIDALRPTLKSLARAHHNARLMIKRLVFTVLINRNYNLVDYTISTDETSDSLEQLITANKDLLRGKIVRTDKYSIGFIDLCRQYNIIPCVIGKGKCEETPFNSLVESFISVIKRPTYNLIKKINTLPNNAKIELYKALLNAYKDMNITHIIEFIKTYEKYLLTDDQLAYINTLKPLTIPIPQQSK